MFGLDHAGQHNNSNAFLASATSDALATELFQQTSNIYGVSLSAPALPRILKEEEDSTHGNMSLMYLNHHQDTSQGHMSATALLQKAATMGSTRSHPQGIFVNSFGLMNSTMSSVFMGDHHNNIARASDRVMMEDKHLHGNSISRNQMGGGMTRDFLGEMLGATEELDVGNKGHDKKRQGNHKGWERQGDRILLQICNVLL
ncbi:hypothetical protein ACET3Z_021186 [Daucus carota]